MSRITILFGIPSTYPCACHNCAVPSGTYSSLLQSVCVSMSNYTLLSHVVCVVLRVDVKMADDKPEQVEGATAATGVSLNTIATQLCHMWYTTTV